MQGHCVCVCGILHSEGVVVTLAAVLGAGESDFTPHRRNSNCSDGPPPEGSPWAGPVHSTVHTSPPSAPGTPHGSSPQLFRDVTDPSEVAQLLSGRAINHQPGPTAQRSRSRAGPPCGPLLGDPSPSESAPLFCGRLCATTACRHCQDKPSTRM